MKQLISLMSVILISSILVAGLSAQAERYMLIYKDKQTFSKLHSHWMQSPSPIANRIFSAGQQAVRGVEIQDSLAGVQAVIVNAQNPTDLSQLVGQAVIEKEIFHKAPRPVNGYQPTKAWDVDARYLTENNHDILKRRRKKPNRPVNPEPPSFSQDEVAGPKTPWGILNVKAIEAWAGSNQGEGARVMVLDTGVDVNHPALKGQIEATKDFVNSGTDVEDKVGHGTHVSGTIAAALASDGFTGVAPKAKILAGRVCNEEGCSSFSVVSGINWAIEKKVDVVNLSLGSDFSSVAERNAVEKAEKAGVVVVAASGNDGKSSVGYPAAYPTVLAVGATDISNIKADFSQWGPELDIAAPGVEVISSVPLGTGCEPKVDVIQANTESVKASCFTGSAYLSNPVKKSLVYAGLGRPEDFKGLNMTNKFALIKRGEIMFSEKVQNAIAANAAGVVIFNNQPGLMSGAISEDGTILAIPIVMIEQVKGEEILKAVTAGQNVEISILTAASDTSAYSGTSMASPHVAGVAALVKAANKALTPAQVRELLKATTTTVDDSAGNQANWYGAGVVNAENAVAKALQLK